ncbi:MAG TPA: DNA mismatch repair endonuclease MutL [Elusimicrobia bacterium]|nr:DNA mismatch repair endonuclease MutL [Elusimicrobiota bacterium]
MPEIKVLPEEVVAKIAAGEVIERPASALKELIENSLDAGAAKIDIEIEKAGKKLIRVRDDGKGMDKEDLLLSLGRHATSKINSFEDLDKLDTFGFRGEALYSIFAVSKLSISSAKKGADSGCAVVGEGGKVTKEMPAPPVKGTIVEATELFFNIPARAKFLKSDNTERGQLMKTVEEAALANLNTAFTLKMDGVEIFSLPVIAGGAMENLKNRAAVIFGKSVYGGLITVESGSPAIAVYGLFSRPDALSATRFNQHFFVNKRPVVSTILKQALYRGYEHMLGGKHPACALFIDLDPSVCDANIHPQKKDVKFSNDNEIFKTVSSAVYSELLKKQTGEVRFSGDAARNKFCPPDLSAETGVKADVPAYGQSRSAQRNAAPGAADSLFEPRAVTGGAAFAAEARPDWYAPPISYLGQVAKSYLLFESAGGLLVIDQHAAQERLLFEKYLEEFSKGSIKVQPLILPVSVELSRSQLETVLKWKDWLATAGFEIEQGGPATALLRATPALFYFTPEALNEFLGYLSEVLGDPSKSTEDIKRNTIATMACKKSIKAHDYIKPPEALRLLEDLKSAKDSFHCPHGRPTLFYLSPSEIARRFGRSGSL